MEVEMLVEECTLSSSRVLYSMFWCALRQNGLPLILLLIEDLKDQSITHG